MASQSVTVIARLHAKPGREAALREEYRKIIAPTRAEPEFLSYDMHESPTDPALVFFMSSGPAMMISISTSRPRMSGMPCRRRNRSWLSRWTSPVGEKYSNEVRGRRQADSVPIC
ncbi:MAG: antibiotic biosynthesis monooxygenase [Nitrospirae bacterium]|nr:antibiotic biosynthesis monooxygenase [Nitrospirota bacterium]